MIPRSHTVPSELADETRCLLLGIRVVAQMNMVGGPLLVVRVHHLPGADAVEGLHHVRPHGEPPGPSPQRLVESTPSTGGSSLIGLEVSISVLPADAVDLRAR